MNHRSTLPETPDLFSRGALLVRLDEDATGWTTLEARDHEDLTLTRVISNTTNLMAVARIALGKANLRGPQRVAVAVGVHADSLLLSIRLERCGLTARAVDGARADLLRFAVACC